MSKHKKHHYVPVSVLKNFRSASEQFFYFYKLNPLKPIIHRNPTKVFCLNHLYSFLNDSGNKDNSVETEFFKNLDTSADPVIKKIIQAVRTGHLPSLTKTERETWDEFYIKQHARNPEKLLSNETQTHLDQHFKEIRTRIYDRCEPHIKDILDDPKFKDRLQQEAKVKSLATKLNISRQVLQERGMVFARIMNSKKSFIIGSSPFVRFGNKGTGELNDPRTELWLPIAHDIAVSPGSYDTPENIISLENNHDHTQLIRKMNRIILDQSFEIGGKSKSLIASLTNHIRTIS